jgi:hypothetical protein
MALRFFSFSSVMLIDLLHCCIHCVCFSLNLHIFFSRLLKCNNQFEHIVETDYINYLFLKQAKILCFSFYLLSFFLYKTGEQAGRTGPMCVCGGGLIGTSETEEVAGKVIESLSERAS